MKTTEIQIREANESDLGDVLEVEKEAFGSEKEAELVNQLLEDESAEPVISLLAFKENEAIGHILFTKATVDSNEVSPSIYILAPLAIKPGYQRQGIGGMLINEGIEKLKDIGVEMVFVLGHEDYYPRHGFKQDAGSLGFAAPYTIPDEHAGAWMVQALTSGGLSEVRGKVRCADALNRPEHWRE
ncbi:N-acetyltransferase [Methanolobus sp. ZRKC2]|uniref:GNAT family N-acetyltransferase n=1 Tax=Methanolobus sp. ZRKC2 TaxID=3125783 RepID=UPI00324B2104